MILTHGEKLMLLVFRSKIKKEEVAYMLGVAPTYLPTMYRYEFIHRKHIERICSVFNVDKSFFYDEEDSKREKIEYVYLIKDNDSGLTKIGYSMRVNVRVKQIKRTHKSAYILHSFRGNKTLEHGLHGIFAHKRVVHEWFNLDQFDIDFIVNNFHTISNKI